ncbi:MAG: M23 family metallopeptidase [Myxococcaceae bacterium]|nr:M23 family metallopeptidase [Myxococcaceae bacterium]
MAHWALGIGVVLVVLLSRRGPAWLRLVGAPEPLSMPVAGLRARDVVSTWHAPRSGGRRHQGVDLFAPSGTEVRAAASGTVWKVGHDALGGQVVSVLGRGPTLYYYAHLDDWAEGLAVGQRVERGALLGHVGNTGNARTTPPHLHFGVYRWGWAWATAVDPAPLLKARRTAPGR